MHNGSRLRREDFFKSEVDQADCRRQLSPNRSLIDNGLDHLGSRAKPFVGCARGRRRLRATLAAREVFFVDHPRDHDFTEVDCSPRRRSRGLSPSRRLGPRLCRPFAWRNSF